MVRPSVTGDIAELQAIEIDAGELFRAVGLDTIADDDPPTAEDLIAHINTGMAWTAELDSVIVGYAVASLVDGDGHLDQVSVRRSAAGRGIGRLLIDEVCRWAAAQGCPAVTLTTFADVPWNGPYYRRLGFLPLEHADCGPELRAIQARERDAGIDVVPRIAMRLDLHRRR